MCANQSDNEQLESDDGGRSIGPLLAKCFGVGAVLGIVGLVAFVAVTLVTGTLWAPIGLIPAAAAGYGIRRVAGNRAGFLTGSVAVVTGQGSVALLYFLLMNVLGGYSIGQADAVILMFGVLVAYKFGSGPDGESAGSGPDGESTAADSRPTEASEEPLDPEDVESEALAEALEGDDDVDLDDLADALEAEAAVEGDGTSVMDEDTATGGDGTAND